MVQRVGNRHHAGILVSLGPPPCSPCRRKKRVGTGNRFHPFVSSRHLFSFKQGIFRMPCIVPVFPALPATVREMRENAVYEQVRYHVESFRTTITAGTVNILAWLTLILGTRLTRCVILCARMTMECGMRTSFTATSWTQAHDTSNLSVRTTFETTTRRGGR